MCCNPAIGEAYFPSCDTTWVYRTCPSGAIMLEGGSCEVVPDFACPPTNAEVNASSCELPGAVCDYYLGCGLTRRCKCEAPLPRSPSGASPTWVCTSADCAR
jgi:hypothetical protein